jgi:hypothetical protein
LFRLDRRAVIKAQNPCQTPSTTFALPQMYELGRLRPRFTCAGEYMPSNLYGAVALHWVHLQAAWDKCARDAIVTRTGPQRARGITKARTGPVVIELCVFCEEGSKLRVATRDERGFKELAVHTSKFIVERPSTA